MSGSSEELPQQAVARAAESDVPAADDFLVWNGIMIKTSLLPARPVTTLPEGRRASGYRGRMISSWGRPEEPDSSGK